MKTINLATGTIMVDDEDYPRVAQLNWSVHRGSGEQETYYAIASIYKADGSHTTVRLHRFILGLTEQSFKVDHINHNGLDNRRENLRVATNTQNLGNSRPRQNTRSKYKGVTFQRNRKSPWRAVVRCDHVIYRLGYFGSEIEAAKAYDRKAIELFGEFALINFPEES